MVNCHCLYLSVGPGLAGSWQLLTGVVSSIVYSVSTTGDVQSTTKCASPGVTAETCYGQQLVRDWSVCELDQSFKKEAVSFVVTIRYIHIS